MSQRLIRFHTDEIEALQLKLENRDLDARREEALRRARYKLDIPQRTFGKPKKRRPEDPEYRAWIRQQPCLICQSTRGVEAAHTGWHGMSARTEDRACVPLCRKHHRTAPDSYHQLRPEPRFERAHGISLAAEVRKRNEAWEAAGERETAGGAPPQNHCDSV
jgi:hypothetical protein